ncbi:hypothetical protein MMC07_001626 [Pseudocyphellaria aurata]|nr:hypothetical protein [Pseudocyphellaria aurata]
MADFIGSRISLISKRDIRYVGTLHEISSENSTVALEQVVSFGTEGRRPEDEVPPSDNVYEYIVFRGSDVKDLRIEDTPKENKPPQPQMPDDPAILGSGRRSTPASGPQAPIKQLPQAQDTLSKQSQPHQSQQPPPYQQQSQQQQTQQQHQHTQHVNQHQQPPPRFQQPQYPYWYPPPQNQRFGPQGFPPGPGFPGMPYGAPPGWYPPSQQFPPPPPGQYYPPQPPIGSVAQPQGVQGPPGPPTPKAQHAASAAPVNSNEQNSSPVQKEPEQNAPGAKLPAGEILEQKPSWEKIIDRTLSEQNLSEEKIPEQTLNEQNAHEERPAEQIAPEKPIATVKLPSASPTLGLPVVAKSTAPPPPMETKPNVAAALAPPALTSNKTGSPVARPVPTGPKNGRIMPAVPRLSPAIKPFVPVNGALSSSSGNVDHGKSKDLAKSEAAHPAQMATTRSYQDTNRDAKAAVAAAMAKLPPAPGQKKEQEVNGDGAVENLTNKVNEMRTSDSNRTPRQPGTGDYVASHRGGRGGHRGGRPQTEHFKKVEVPTTDYDFASANAKFNKQDLVKEAIATGSSIGSPADLANPNDASAGLVNGARKGRESSGMVPPVASYNKTSSFFDNISSESKDRDDAIGKKLGGREFRSEEQKKNLETFGQGSVDNGYRGGFRGRGRGRGYGRPRGGYGRGGRGGPRGFHGAGAVTTEQPKW